MPYEVYQPHSFSSLSHRAAVSDVAGFVEEIVSLNEIRKLEIQIVRDTSLMLLLEADSEASDFKFRGATQSVIGDIYPHKPF